RDLDWQNRYTVDEMVRSGWDARRNAGCGQARGGAVLARGPPGDGVGPATRPNGGDRRLGAPRACKGEPSRHGIRRWVSGRCTESAVESDRRTGSAVGHPDDRTAEIVAP